jgi:hypothetical protein
LFNGYTALTAAITLSDRSTTFTKRAGGHEARRFMPIVWRATMPDGIITRRPLISVAFLGLTGCFGGSTAVVFAPRVWFEEPKDGALVTSPVRVVFGLQGYEARPFGVTDAETGHHHVIIDSAAIARGQKIPTDANHIHLGGGGAETLIELSPGPHTLIAQLADGTDHIAFGGFLTSEPIHVEVVTIG